MKFSYKTKVKFIKTILLTTIIIIIVIFFISPALYLKFKTKGRMLASQMLNYILKKSDIKPPTMSGTVKNGGAYYLSAEKITNNFFDFKYKEQKTIHLTKPYLMYNTNKNNLVFSCVANTATLDTSTNILHIPGYFNITSNQSYKANLNTVVINFNSYILESHNPVIIYLKDKKVTSNAIMINKTDNIIVLKGPVEVSPLPHTLAVKHHSS